jgi:hypothetical protein
VAGTIKAQDFATRVRLGGHLQKLRNLRAEISLARDRAQLAVGDLEQLEIQAAAIADGLAKDLV